jgi:hypothetical protein
MYRQWGNYQNNPMNVVPPTFPQKFPFQSTPYQTNQQQSFGASTPYEYFQKPPIPMGNFQQQQGGQQGNPMINKGVNPLMQHFKNPNGQMDFDKVFSTVSQMVNTYHQVSPLVKQIGTFVKGFK